MQSKYTIKELQEVVGPLAEQYGVESVSLFGSYSKGTAKPDSDVDFLIEKGSLKGLFALSSFRLALEDALQTPVDLVSKDISDKAFLSNLLFTKNDLFYSLAVFYEFYSMIAFVSLLGILIHGFVDTVFFRPQIQFIFWIMLGIIRVLTAKNQEKLLYDRR